MTVSASISVRVGGDFAVVSVCDGCFLDAEADDVGFFFFFFVLSSDGAMSCTCVESFAFLRGGAASASFVAGEGEDFGRLRLPSGAAASGKVKFEYLASSPLGAMVRVTGASSTPVSVSSKAGGLKQGPAEKRRKQE